MMQTESQSPHVTTQVWSVWSGVLGVSLFFFALLYAGFLPLWPPTLTQEQVVALYQQNYTDIRIGMMVMMISGGFLLPMFGAISVQLKRIEGRHTTLANTQLAAGSANAVFFIFTGFFFLVTAFRPDRSPELTYMMNDCCWFMAVIVWPPAFAQNMAIGFAILGDKSEQPVFPRWLAFLNFWVALLFIPGALVPFFKTGPFAWNGMLGFWLPATVYGFWFMAMVPMLLKAIKRQAMEAGEA